MGTNWMRWRTDPYAGIHRTPAMSILELRVSQRFRRDPDTVRCHFLDIQHHLAHQVHKGVRYTILTEEAGRLRLRQEFSVLGMKKRDELVLYATRDGRVVQEFLSGDFAGGTLQLRFDRDGDDTRVDVALTAPLRGMMRLLQPIVKRQVLGTVKRALEEDRADLEEGRYQPGRWARGALALATRSA
jgi:hypothetical protein